LRIRLELLRFWDAEALSRRANQQIETKQHSTDEVAQQNSKDYSRISEESAKLTIAAESETEEKRLTVHVPKEQLESKRNELLNDLWWLQHTILSRRQDLRQRKESEQPQH